MLVLQLFVDFWDLMKRFLLGTVGFMFRLWILGRSLKMNVTKLVVSVFLVGLPSVVLACGSVNMSGEEDLREADTVKIAELREVAAVSAKIDYSPETRAIIDAFKGPYARGVDPLDYPTHIWEGPRPTTFYEAPMLTQMVAEGKIPPLMERLPHVDDIFYERPMQEIGVYGGTYRTVGGLNIVMVDADGWCTKHDTDGDILIPWVCKDVQVSDDGKTYTYTLRRGHKWSDGSVFDTEDVRMAWHDLNFNRDYTPFTPAKFRDPVTGNEMKVDIVDNTTFTFSFDTPVYDLIESRIADADCFGGFCMYTPDTYSKQFHPKYADDDEIKALLEKYNYKDWTELFRRNYDVRRIVDFPWLGAYTVCEPSERRRSMCRNPFFMGVDPAGNQLPYTDKWTSFFFESNEVALFRAMKGEEDHSGRYFGIDIFPLLKANMVKGDYSILDWSTGASGGNTDSTSFNQTFNDDQEIGRLMRTKDFRLAISHAVNRESMADVLYLGMSTPRNLLPLPIHPYYPGAHLEEVEIDYNPDLANELFDKVGLIDTDGDGMRNRSDGKGNLVLYTGSEGPNNRYLNLLVDDLAKVGIELKWREIKRYYRVIRSNQGYIGPGRGGCAFSGWGGSPSIPPMNWWSHCGPEIGTYVETKGKDGMGPTGPDPDFLPLAPEGTYPADSTGLFLKYEQKFLDGRQYVKLDPRRIELGKELNTFAVVEKYGLGMNANAPSIHVKRNNLRNVPHKHQCRGWSGCWSELYYFEDGIDNINHPGNVSKKYKSWSFR